MSEENLEPGLGADNPDNSGAPETKTGSEPQSLWGELSDEQKSFLSKKGLKNPADAVKSYMELESRPAASFLSRKTAMRKLWQKFIKNWDGQTMLQVMT